MAFTIHNIMNVRTGNVGFGAGQCAPRALCTRKAIPKN